MVYDKTLSAQILERDTLLRQEIEKLDTYSRLKSQLKKIEIDEIEYYLAEGDLLLDEDELLIHAQELDVKERASRLTHLPQFDSNDKLLGIVNNGRIVRWAPGLVLTYCVLERTFRTKADYKLVRKNMLKATRDWEKTCGIKFKHISALDKSMSIRPDGVIFPVRGIEANGSFIASAFFPTYPKARRRILIDPSYFKTQFNKVGVLRHELGHVLGLRHEHIKSGAPAECPDEAHNNTVDLTKYDPNSVMHYFCGGVGSRKLSISELDKVGSQKLYGPPYSNYDFIDE